MTDAVFNWLGAQRELIERWLAAPAAGDAQESARRFWDSVAQGLSPQAQTLARQLAQLGPGFLAGTSDALFEVFGASTTASSSADAPPFARWLDVAPIGYFREHHAQSQELARALVEYRRVASQMMAAIGRIHAEALELLAQKIAVLEQAGETVSDSRRLYALWIECGEQAFAQQARGEIFGRLQGELVNAGMRVRMAQQAIAEKFLQSLDLPTRAELNSVHKRLKGLRERVAELEAQIAPTRRER